MASYDKEVDCIRSKPMPSPIFSITPRIPSTRIIFSLVLMLVSFGFALNFYHTVQQNNLFYESKLGVLREQVQTGFKHALQELNQHFKFLISHYAQVDEITHAIVSQDRVALQQAVTEEYFRLKQQEPNLHVMHFLNPQNITILRMHKPQSYGDDLTEIRPIVAHVNRTQKQASGFEPGKNGITYRITTPIFDQAKKHVGALEFGIRPTYFVEILAERFGVRTQILVKTDSLKNLTYETNFSKIQDYSVVYEDAFFHRFELNTIISDEVVVQEGQTYLFISDIILSTFDGKELVRFQILKDITPFAEKHRSQTQVYIASNIALYILFVLILYIIFNRYHAHLLSAIARLDLSEQRRLEVVHQSHKDELTRAYNRRYFNEVLDELIAHNRIDSYPHSALFFDLDHFKDINDRYGHLVGDEILYGLARFVMTSFREGALLFRWGGEEFCLLLKETSLSEAYQQAEKLRREITEQAWPRHVHLTISIGVTQIQPTDTPRILQHRLDELLYRAKESGRNCSIHD